MLEGSGRVTTGPGRQRPGDIRPVGARPAPACLLDRLSLFSRLSVRERKRIAARITPRGFRKGETILHGGADDRNVYFVITGRVKAISCSACGKQVSFDELGPGEIFGELAAIDGLGRSTDIVAAADSQIGVMSQADFLLTNRECPEVALKTMQRLTRLARKLLGRIIEFSTLNVNDRVQAELLRIAGLASIAGRCRLSNRRGVSTWPRRCR